MWKHRSLAPLGLLPKKGVVIRGLSSGALKSMFYLENHWSTLICTDINCMLESSLKADSDLLKNNYFLWICLNKNSYNKYSYLNYLQDKTNFFICDCNLRDQNWFEQLDFSCSEKINQEKIKFDLLMHWFHYEISAWQN